MKIELVGIATFGKVAMDRSLFYHVTCETPPQTINAVRLLWMYTCSEKRRRSVWNPNLNLNPDMNLRPNTIVRMILLFLNVHNTTHSYTLISLYWNSFQVRTNNFPSFLLRFRFRFQTVYVFRNRGARDFHLFKKSVMPVGNYLVWLFFRNF